MVKKKVLVCGATGFIGRNIAERFAMKEEFEVYGTYNKTKPSNNARIKIEKADLTINYDAERLVNGKNIIIQAAATTSGVKDTFAKPYYHVTDNAIMNSFIFRSAHINNVSHVIFLSSSSIYSPSDKPVKETDFDYDKIVSAYFGVAWTKVYLEKMCEFYSRIGNVKFTVIRPANIYGPYDKFDLERSHVFGATITKVLTAKNDRITVWGSGEEERDLLYVSDLVDFVELAIDKQQSKFGVYNVGTASSISINDLVEKIIISAGKKLKIDHDLSKPAIPTKLSLDPTKAKKELGWSQKVSLDEGIEKTIDWYRENILSE